MIKATADDQQRGVGDRASQVQRDRAAAHELRARLKDQADESIELATLRELFGDTRFTPARKREVEQALNGAGIEVIPSLRSAGRRKMVVLRTGAPKPKHTSLKQRITSIEPRFYGLVGVVGTILGVISLGLPLGWFTSPPPPSKMTGDLNIAVTPFTTNGRATPDGTLLAQAAYQDLRSKVASIEPGLQVDLRGPGDPGITAVDDQSAPALAQGISADIVLHGSLHQDPTGTTVDARFYLNRAKLPSAGELAGNYDYGPSISAPFPLSSSPQTRAAVRARLVSETDDIATFLAGVGDYQTHEYGPAQKHLSAVIRTTKGSDVHALALLLLANVLAQESHPAQARALYAAAISYPTTHARAAYGLAEMQYTIARGNCSARRANVTGLGRARAAFAGVPINQSDSAAAALLRAKVAFGLGQVDLCLSQAGRADDWLQARTEMQSVVASYGATMPDLRDDSAEAYAGVGLADLHLPPVNYAAASAAYAKAAQLTSIPSRRAFFTSMAAYADTHRGVSN